MRILGLFAAGALVIGTGPAAEAQSLASRVSAVRDGKVRMTFASRDDICGFGNGISRRGDNRNNTHSWMRGRSEDVEYDVDCSEGPVRVVVDMQGGRPSAIRTYVGGRWRPDSRARDLGAFPVREATDWLMSVAAVSTGKVAGHAILATTLADSVQMAQPFYQLARNPDRPSEAREQAIFWLGQLRGESTQLLRNLYSSVGSENLKDKVIFALSQQQGVNDQWLLDLVSNERESIEMRKKALFWAGQTGAPMAKLAAIYSRTTEREMKDQMIFVFSQRHDRAAVDKLMDIAKNDPDRETRRKALFWLGQSKDPRVATMLADMINGRE